MNPLMAQFVEEAAELLDAVDTGLLALEQDPTSPGALNEVFRAAHTLKGSSGLFDVGPLTTLMHAAEDLLDAVRAGELRAEPAVVDALMVAFDLVRSWTAELAATEQLPSDAADASVAPTQELRSHLAAPGAVVAVPAPRRPEQAEPPVWALATAAPLGGGTAVRYRPRADCFFSGADPLHLVRQLQDVTLLRITPTQPWPAIADLDEYDCRLELLAVTAQSVADVEHLFRYQRDEVEIVAVPADTLLAWRGGTAAAPVLRELRELARAQLQVLTSLPTGELGGTFSAAALMLGAGDALTGAADPALEQTVQASRDAGSSLPLHQWCEGLLVELGEALDAVEQAGAPTDAVQPDAAPPDADATTRGAAPRTLKVDQAKVDQVMELVGELIVAKNALPFLARSAEDEHGVPALARALKEQYTVLNRLTEELQAAVMEVRMVPVSQAFARFPRLVRDVTRKLGKQARLVTEGEDTQADKDVISLVADPLVHLVRNALDHGIETPEARTAAGKPAQAVLRIAAQPDGDAVVISVSDDGRGIDPQVLRDKAVQRGLLEPERAAALRDDEAVNLVFLAGLSTATTVSDLSGRGVGMDAVRDAVERLGGTVTVRSTVGEGTTVRLRIPLSMAVTKVMVVGVGGQRFGVPVDVVQETVRVPGHAVQRVREAETVLLRERILPLVSLHRLLDAPPPGREADRAVLVINADGAPLGLTVDRFHENLDVVVKPLRGVVASCSGFAGTALLGDGDVLLILNTRELLHAS